MKIIVAIDENYAIGKDNDLLCHLPKDLAFFKEKTKNCPIIMGLKTWESLPFKPLPNRTNIILTEDLLKFYEDNKEHRLNYDVVPVFGTKGLKHLAQEFGNRLMDSTYVIGGAFVYSQMIDYVDEMYITHIHHAFNGADKFFPKFNKSDWLVVSEIFYKNDEKNPYDFTIRRYVRKSKPKKLY